MTTTKRSYNKVIPLAGETIEEARARNKRRIKNEHNKKMSKKHRAEMTDEQKKLTSKLAYKAVTAPILQQKMKELFDMITMFDKQGKLDEMTPLVNAHMTTISAMQALTFD